MAESEGIWPRFHPVSCVTLDGSPPSSEPSFQLHDGEASLTDPFLLSGLKGMVPHPQVSSEG